VSREWPLAHSGYGLLRRRVSAESRCRYSFGGPARIIASLPAGDDDFSAFALEDAGSVTLYLNHVLCQRVGHLQD
jgi:hypothetical protein